MRYCGTIAYRRTYEETDENGEGNGIWKEDITKRTYKGDVIKNYSRNSNGESINDNIQISNSISIIADPYALTNFTSIIYIEWMGIKWKVSSVDATNRPRLILSLGGEWNEETGRSAQTS